MATRTPGLQPRSQYHRNWGNYTDGTAGTGDLPHVGTPLSASEHAKLEPGDLAYVSGTLPGVYYCTSAGSLGPFVPATWVLLAAGGSVIQTIRDAHQLVVAQGPGAPFAISTVGSGPNAVGISCDFLDAGDGAQLEAALAAAAALIAAGYPGVDVRVRPCDIVLDQQVVTAPLTIGTNVNLIGAGGASPSAARASRITGLAEGAATQRIFDLLGGARLSGFWLLSPAPDVAPAAEPDRGMVEFSGITGEVHNCVLRLIGGGAASRTLNCAIAAPALVTNSRFLVRDCVINLDNLLAEAVPTESRAIDFFAPIAAPGTDLRVEGVMVGTAPNVGVRAVNCDGPIVRDFLLENGTGAFGLLHQASVAGTFDGMRMSDVDIRINADDTRVRAGISLQFAVAAIRTPQITNARVLFTGADPNVNDRFGLRVQPSAGGVLRGMQIANLLVAEVAGLSTGFDYGIQLDTSAAGVGGGILDVSMTNIEIQSAQLEGVHLRTDGNGFAIERTSISNSKMLNAVADGILIDADANDTILIANHFNGSATAINDAGTGTEAAHNIVL